MIRRSSTPDVLQKSLSINTKVPFHENLSPLPSHRSGVPEWRNLQGACLQKQSQTALILSVTFI
jgi:hypothetical protein